MKILIYMLINILFFAPLRLNHNRARGGFTFCPRFHLALHLFSLLPTPLGVMVLDHASIRGIARGMDRIILIRDFFSFALISSSLLMVFPQRKITKTRPTKQIGEMVIAANLDIIFISDSFPLI